MKILVLNAGSSSLKYELYSMVKEEVIANGNLERIGTDSAILTHRVTGRTEVRYVEEILDHTIGIRRVLAILSHEEHGVLKSADEIDAVGHRVVHGGEAFSKSVIINDEVKKEIRNLFELAPLHNPPSFSGIVAMEANLPHVPQIAVFDTAFHQSMPAEAYLYPLPMELYRKYGIRKYGFHGTSHNYVAQRAAKFLGKRFDDLKIITCHIGNGVSITAVKDGKSVDTSMGMTPLEGLMMGTRCGDIDPAIVPFVMEKEELTIGEVNSMMNKHSGLLAISGGTNDMREIDEGIERGDEIYELAFNMFEYRLRKYIGSYAAAMGGVDVIVFTAGIGENMVRLRKNVCENLGFLGVDFDAEENEKRASEDRAITKADSRVQVLIIPTKEELMIARQTYELVKHRTE